MKMHSMFLQDPINLQLLQIICTGVGCQRYARLPSTQADKQRCGILQQEPPAAE